MRLSYPLLTFPLLHSVGLVSGRSEIGLDGDLYGEIPRPTSEPLLYQDEFKHGAILMETRLGHRRNGISRRNLALGSRQLTCNDPGYVLTCPTTKQLPCCPAAHPICCTHPSSTLCCSVGTFCNGINTCCYDGQVACGNPEGCCPGGTVCCGIWCCIQGFECRNGGCIEVTRISLSIADASSRSMESVASVRSQSSESATSTGTTYGNGNGNGPLVGGVVGGAIGVIVLGLIGVLLWRRKGPYASIPSQQPFIGQQPSSQPITPASQIFPVNLNYIGGPPVTYATQPGRHPQQVAPLTLLEGASTAGQTSTASQQPASTPLAVNMWIQRGPVIHQEDNGGLAGQFLPAEGAVDQIVLCSNGTRGPPHSLAAPMEVPYSPSEASGGASSPAPPYSFTPPLPEKSRSFHR